jgi:hypothetical protein
MDKDEKKGMEARIVTHSANVDEDGRVEFTQTIDEGKESGKPVQTTTIVISTVDDAIRIFEKLLENLKAR